MQDREAAIRRIRELTALLKEASRTYYAEDREIMSNLEYDRLYDELRSLEEATGVVLADSPTVNVGYASVDELPKERHASPMLSLDKTKDREALAAWLGPQEGLLSWKLDGLTVVLTYEDGVLSKAVTRGNGEIGEVITENARTFKNLPGRIPYKGTLVLRGEAVILYSDFERINAQLEKEALEKGDAGSAEELRYKNPRNLCSGSVRQLSSAVTAKRNVRLYAFTLVSAPGVDFMNSREAQLRFLADQGFEVVEYVKVTGDTLVDAVGRFETRIRENDTPSDGLVLTLEDLAYSESLGRTAKFPRDSMAFKWADEIRETKLLEVEWSPSRTGLINPVAIFEPVELEGTTVQRASLHNVSIIRSLELGIGDTIRVYKANMIIPQVESNVTKRGGLPIPDRCPACGGPAVIRQVLDAAVLVCENPGCPAKALRSYELMVSRGALNIEGLSEMTLEKFIAAGLLHKPGDLFRLGDHKERIETMEGFGEKSFLKLSESIERARETTLDRVIFALGIPGIGQANARVLTRHFEDDITRIRRASEEELAQVEGVGAVLAASIRAYFDDPVKTAEMEDLLGELRIQQSAAVDKESPIAGKTFVITGSVEHFENRDALKRFIEERGGKTSGSVSAKTDYLINNDAASGSSKNRKAKELGIPIITEEEFLAYAHQDRQ